MDRKEKREILKKLYLINIVCVVMIAAILFFELPHFLFMVVFACMFIASVISGYLFLDLVTDK